MISLPHTLRIGRAAVLCCAASFCHPAYAAAAGTPAFDCKKAEHEIELLICKDAALAALDRKLAQRFKEAHGNLSPEQKKELDVEQRGWIKGRNDCWKSDDKAACTREEYTRRTVILEARYGLAMVGTTESYDCNGTEVFFTPVKTEPLSANVVRGEEVSTVILTTSASGAKYEGEFGMSFWSKGGEATLEWPQGTAVTCKKK